MRYQVRPISDRTPFGSEQKNSPFTVTWTTADQLLDRELYYLDARDVVLEMDVAEHAIRVDGTIRADAKVHSAAVRLAFDSQQGPLTYATDRFVRPSYRREGMQKDWQHNLYAIAKALEALRLVDRYEVTQRGEQYAGFKQLGAGTPMPAPMSRLKAETVLRQVAYGDGDAQTDVPIGRVYRRAQGFAHPDRHAGDRALWDQVEEAGRVLGLRS